MKKYFYRLISIAAIVYVLFGIYLYLNQKAFLYFPTAKAVQPFPVKVFAINGEKINVIVANPGKEQALIYFGGNAESVGYSSERIAHDFPHYTVYLVNYRGYGGSSGEPQARRLFLPMHWRYMIKSKTDTSKSLLQAVVWDRVLPHTS